MIEFTERNGYQWNDCASQGPSVSDGEETTIHTMIDAAAGALGEDDFVAWVALHVRLADA
jgi:hypothetical protein